MNIRSTSRYFTKAVQPGPVNVVGGGTNLRSGAGQRGFATLALALIGLLVGSSLAVSALQLAGGTLVSSVGPSASIDARSAAEHALWRLRYDPSVHDEMTGSPPETTYILAFPGGDATVSIEASSDPPADNGLTASLTVIPGIVPERFESTRAATPSVSRTSPSRMCSVPM